MHSLAVGDGEIHDFGLLSLIGKAILKQGGRSLPLRGVPLKQALAFLYLLLDLRVHALKWLRLTFKLTKAVLEWKSPPSLKASIILTQFVMCASTLSSSCP